MSAYCSSGSVSLERFPSARGLALITKTELVRLELIASRAALACINYMEGQATLYGHAEKHLNGGCFPPSNTERPSRLLRETSETLVLP